MKVCVCGGDCGGGALGGVGGGQGGPCLLRILLLLCARFTFFHCFLVNCSPSLFSGSSMTKGRTCSVHVTVGGEWRDWKLKVTAALDLECFSKG